MIIGFFGDPRAGKTLSSVNEIKILLEECPTRKVYSNIKLEGIDYEPLSVEMVLDIVESDKVMDYDPIYFIDEIYLWLDSRSSLSTLSKVLSWFLMQTGKLGVNTDVGMIFIYTSQYPDLIDNRLWSVSNVKVFCEKMEFMGSKFIVQNIFEKRMLGVQSYKNVIDAESVYKHYNTRERVLSFTTDRFNKNKSEKIVSDVVKAKKKAKDTGQT